MAKKSKSMGFKALKSKIASEYQGKPGYSKARIEKIAGGAARKAGIEKLGPEKFMKRMHQGMMKARKSK